MQYTEQLHKEIVNWTGASVNLYPLRVATEWRIASAAMTRLHKAWNECCVERVRLRSMDRLSAFGLFAVSAMLIFYALESRSRWFILAFAGSCVLASAYGFLQGAWPFGVVEGVWSLVAVRRWWTTTRTPARDIT